MQDLDGKKVPIGTLFSQEFFFRIPEYQRPFSWEADNFDDLIDDVIASSRDQEYFLGTVVLHERDDLECHDVVDGQQRLTSLMILLACLRDLVNDAKFKDGLQEKIVQPENVVDGIPEKVRLEVRDREIFNDLVLQVGGSASDRQERDLPEPEWRYVSAAKIFRSKLAELAEEEIQNLIAFLNQKCVVIYLATSTFDDAFRLFTIVNDRGKQLRRIDVLKSINLAPHAITRETVRNRLAQTWEDLEKDLGEAIFESVFHLIRLILIKDKPQGDLLREFENRVFPQGVVTQGESFMSLVFEYVELYKALFLDYDFVSEEAEEHKRYCALMHIMDSEFKASEWRACVLSFAKRFGASDLYVFCLLMEKVYLAHWVQGVRKDERYAEYAKILSQIEGAKLAAEVIEAITYDEQAIIEAVGNPNIYGASYCKYILLRLELATAEHDAIRMFDAKSTEHVLPVTPDEEGYWAANHNLEEIGEYVNSIGNLVLLSKSKNSSASNRGFSTKKEKYLGPRVSDYPRSIEVLGYDDWDKETILRRTQAAKELILRDP